MPIIKTLPGANMDIDLATPADQIEWQQAECPWNAAEGENNRKCAVKNISICPYFCGIRYLDQVLCSYPQPNPYQDRVHASPIRIEGPKFVQGAVCEPIIRSLPEWFGIEIAIQEYVVDIAEMPTFLAQNQDETVGFLTLKIPNSFTAEIHVMGILPQWHQQGIGRQLLCSAEIFLHRENIEFLQVKTLSASHPDSFYAQTRLFYLAMGFVPLQEFPGLWGTENPCLQLIKKL